MRHRLVNAGKRPPHLFRQNPVRRKSKRRCLKGPVKQRLVNLARTGL